MVSITASLVKDLRDKTAAGIMDCKTALTETGGDTEAAIDWLRKKGLAKAAKKAGRTTADGLIGIATEAGRGAVVEVNSETDFVARGDDFQDFVQKAAKLALAEEGDLKRLLAAPMEGGNSAAEVLAVLIAKVGENMAMRRSEMLSVSPGIVASYAHNAVSPGLGKIGVLVALESQADEENLALLGKQLAMHIAASSPLALDIASLDPQTVERERAIYAEQAHASGRPENVIEKIIEGQTRKFYKESVLTSQVFVIDGETPVTKVLENASKELGTSVRIAGFVRFAVGEGIEKPEDDFVAEVRSISGR